MTKTFAREFKYIQICDLGYLFSYYVYFISVGIYIKELGFMWNTIWTWYYNETSHSYTTDMWNPQISLSCWNDPNRKVSMILGLIPCKDLYWIENSYIFDYLFMSNWISSFVACPSVMVTRMVTMSSCWTGLLSFFHFRQMW